VKSTFATPKAPFQKPRLGFVLGKFMPPHQGHVFLCEFARQYCDKLVILVCSLENEPIPGVLRYEWMKELFPDCHVVHETRDLPQEPKDENDTAFWEAWKGAVRYAMQSLADERSGGRDGIGGSNWTYPDVVFASEHYGHRLASTVGAEFVPVDIARTTRDISGTDVRNNPFVNWDYIPHVVRPYFVKRVCLFGPESTGKSTLGRLLAQTLKTVYCPEYGRTYTETFGHENLTEADLFRIVQGHQASVLAAKRQANKVLIEDTDPVMTAIWSDMLLGKRDPWFDGFNDHADLYLLCDVDLPWVNDGTRYFDNDADRQRFFDLCETELERRGVQYVKVTGDLDQRFDIARYAIREVLGV
jgi:HTH-type transcriptional repressor of NAD biosynthesis genes